MTSYELTFRGEAGPLIRGAFEEFQVTSDGGVTTLHCTLPDGPALHGVIDRVFSLGLDLIDVHQVDDGEPSGERT